MPRPYAMNDPCSCSIVISAFDFSSFHPDFFPVLVLLIFKHPCRPYHFKF